MTMKAKQSKKAAKGSKRKKVLAQYEDEPNTATATSPAEAPQAKPAIPATSEAKVAVESQEPVAQVVPVYPGQPVQSRYPQRSGQGQHKRGAEIASDCWQTYQAAIDFCLREGLVFADLAQAHRKIQHFAGNISGRAGKGVPAVPITPFAKQNVEKTKETE